MLKAPKLKVFDALQGFRSYGRYWIRTSDPFRVKEVRYHCANRPLSLVSFPILASEILESQAWLCHFSAR